MWPRYGLLITVQTVRFKMRELQHLMLYEQDSWYFIVRLRQSKNVEGAIWAKSASRGERNCDDSNYLRQLRSLSEIYSRRSAPLHRGERSVGIDQWRHVHCAAQELNCFMPVFRCWSSGRARRRRLSFPSDNETPAEIEFQTGRRKRKMRKRRVRNFN